jgi:SAM-dependent methyltransferase
MISLFNKKKLIKYIEWDIFIWQKSLKYWYEFYKSYPNLSKGLEIGGKNGGLSNFFLEETKVELILCSDFGSPTEKAKLTNNKFFEAKRIKFLDIDANKIDLKSNSLDFVFFKSVLGSDESNINSKKALLEINRVLRPGGVLFFCENLKGSFFHQFSRKIFRSWGSSWNYTTIKRMRSDLNVFQSYKIKSFGYFSVFIPSNWIILKFLAYLIDSIFCIFISSELKYMSYGHAIKKN